MSGSSDTGTVHCENCGTEIDPAIDTHYRVEEEERPVKQLEKAEDELEFDDYFSYYWYLCPDCVAQVIDIPDDSGPSFEDTRSEILEGEGNSHE